jgi:hypothetical protein
MIDIDFLPNRYREQRAGRQVKIWQLGVLVIFGGAIAATAIGQFALRCAVARQVADVEPPYASAKNDEQRFAQLQQQLRDEQTTAELYAYLNHPWPRTQILAAIARPLPDSLTLGDLLVTKETDQTVSAGFQRNEPSRGASSEPGQSDTQTTPAERDLNRLRDEHDRSLTVVYTSGVTTDSAALHRYVAQLGADVLFTKVDLRSFESSSSGLPAGLSKFSLRLVIRPGYGQPNGPTGTTPSRDIDESLATTQVANQTPDQLP